MTKTLVCSAVAASFCVSVYGAVAVLNAKQLPDEDLLADLDLPAAPAAETAEKAADAVDEAAAPVVEAVENAAAEVAEAVAEAPAAADAAADAVAEAVDEAAAPVAEAVENAAAEVAEAAPAAEVPVADALDDLLPEVKEEAAPVAEVAPAAEVPVADALDDLLPEVKEEAAPVAEEAVAEAPAAAEEVAEAPAVAEEDAEEAVAEAPAAVAEVADAPAAEVSSEDALVSELATLQAVRAEAQNAHGISEFKAGVEALNNGRYPAAIEHFKNAQNFVSETAVDKKGNRISDLANDNLAEAYYRLALQNEQLRNFKDGLRAANQAVQLGHTKAPELVTRLDDAIKNPPAEPEPPKVRRDREPEYRENVKKINDHLNRAREFYATGEYDKARDQVELVLRDNPFNTEAVTLLRRLENRRYDFVNHEFEATRETMIREVKEIWTPRTYATDTADLQLAATNNNTTNLPPDSIAIEKKMKSIVIPEINFRQANLTDVITFLSDASRENDTDNTPAEKKGINFILQTSGGQSTTAAPASDDPFGGSSFDTAAPSGGATTFTFSARYVPLKDVLDIVMQTGNLKYRIKGNVVVIMDKNAPDDDLFFRMYSVLPTLEEKVTTIGDSSSNDNDIMSMGTASISSGTSDWKEFFRKFGVEWPDGSSVEYMRAVGRLVVKNTTENLANLETVLSVLNVTPKQIEIEARFVEVSQADLDSLGIEWNLNNNWEMLEHKDDAGLPIDQRRRIVTKKGSLTSGFDYLTGNDNPDINDGGVIADNILTVGSVLTNPELSMVLHMLSSRQNTDLLSAPKVVTKNGQEATIKVVTEYIYPTEYDVEMLESSDDDDNTTYSGAVVEPGSFQTREVGVQLTVLPQVTEDGQLIDLTLAPQVVSEPTWKNYGSSYPVYSPDGSYQQAQLNMEQPFFPVRSIQTSIQIYNGATVVMGGMITETRVSHEDKVPFLGDIPLIGRLFRNSYESSEKRNLLIFVSARLVDPAGRFVRDQKDLSLMTEANGGL